MKKLEEKAMQRAIEFEYTFGTLSIFITNNIFKQVFLWRS